MLAAVSFEDVNKNLLSLLKEMFLTEIEESIISETNFPEFISQIRIVLSLYAPTIN